MTQWRKGHSKVHHRARHRSTIGDSERQEEFERTLGKARADKMQRLYDEFPEWSSLENARESLRKEKGIGARITDEEVRKHAFYIRAKAYGFTDNEIKMFWRLT